MRRGMPSSPPPERHEPLPGLFGLPAFLLRQLSPRGRRVVMALGIVLLVALAAEVIVEAPRLRGSQHERARAEARAAKAAAAVRRVRLTRESRPRIGSGPAAAGLRPGAALRTRRALMTSVEASVLADARDRFRSRGPYLGARCTGMPKRPGARPPQDNLAVPIARVECLAIERALAPSAQTAGVLLGQPFYARVDFRRGRYAWCKIEEEAGEGFTGVQVSVPVPRACGGG
jgi:hypothetical protein